jgi:hypothetical protein
MNSSFETTWVGIGESTPFFRSRCPLRTHMALSFGDAEVRRPDPGTAAIIHQGSAKIKLPASFAARMTAAV